MAWRRINYDGQHTDPYMGHQGPFYRISNYIHYKVWDEITYPLPIFNGATVEIR